MPRHSGRVIKELGQRQATPVQTLLERFSIEVLHHDDIAALERGDIVNRTDVGAVQGRDHPGFALEAGAQLRSSLMPSDGSLRATMRPSRVSRALYTSPMPPAPASSSSS